MRRPRWPMSRPASARTTGTYQARQMLEQLGLDGSEDPARLSGGEARRAALARVLAPEPGHSPARRADQPSRPHHHRMAGARARRPPRRDRHDQPRPAVSLQPVAQHGVARPRRDARVERGFADFEDWRDEVLAEEERNQHKLDRKIVAEEHWLRYGVSGAAQAQRQAARRLADACARRAAPIAAPPAAPTSPRARPRRPAPW